MDPILVHEARDALDDLVLVLYPLLRHGLVGPADVLHLAAGIPLQVRLLLGQPLLLGLSPAGELHQLLLAAEFLLVEEPEKGLRLVHDHLLLLLLPLLPRPPLLFEDPRQVGGLVADGPQRGLGVRDSPLVLFPQGFLRRSHPQVQGVDGLLHLRGGLVQVSVERLLEDAKVVLKLGGVGLGALPHVLGLLLHVGVRLLDAPHGLL
mmetsp:Transcript_113957/g.302861  ORF Transcript_113957/g.302861 Transcript_113957/m.302861 type:complete len:206 (-) Transcript_113957:241-858(-)